MLFSGQHFSCLFYRFFFFHSCCRISEVEQKKVGKQSHFCHFSPKETDVPFFKERQTTFVTRLIRLPMNWPLQTEDDGNHIIPFVGVQCSKIRRRRIKHIWVQHKKGASSSSLSSPSWEKEEKGELNVSGQQKYERMTSSLWPPTRKKMRQLLPSSSYYYNPSFFFFFISRKTDSRKGETAHGETQLCIHFPLLGTSMRKKPLLWQHRKYSSSKKDQKLRHVTMTTLQKERKRDVTAIIKACCRWGRMNLSNLLLLMSSGFCGSEMKRVVAVICPLHCSHLSFLYGAHVYFGISRFIKSNRDVACSRWSDRKRACF